MKVALVYDRVNKWGGAERVLLALHEIWPQAPLFTAVYDEEKAGWAKVFPKVIPSFLQHFPLAKTHHEFYPWLTPLAFETFNFDEYEVVISITSAEAKSIITKPQTLNICYCLTPTRYLWSGYFDYLGNPGLGVLNEIARLGMKVLWPYLRLSDQIASSRPDCYIAISKTVRERIKKYYQRESIVVFPPINTKLFVPRVLDNYSSSPSAALGVNSARSSHPAKRGSNNKRGSAEKYFLIVSRLVPYKRIDIAIEVFNKLGWNLKIIGTGIEEKRLKEMAKPNIEFLGELTEEDLISYYQNCQGLVVCWEEDFGLAALEAQACGKPVIALNRGGAAEIVVDGRTGLLFQEETVESLYQALKAFERQTFQTVDCCRQAGKFSQEVFKKKFKETIENLWKNYQKKNIML